MKLKLQNLEEYQDNFNYYNLITNIDPDYRLFYNKKEKCFLVLNIAKNYQICLKFNSFSLNLPIILQKTRIEKSKALLENIEKENEQLSLNYQNSCINELTQKSLELLRYSSRVPAVSNIDIKKIIEG